MGWDARPARRVMTRSVFDQYQSPGLVARPEVGAERLSDRGHPPTADPQGELRLLPPPGMTRAWFPEMSAAEHHRPAPSHGGQLLEESGQGVADGLGRVGVVGVARRARALEVGPLAH